MLQGERVEFGEDLAFGEVLRSDDDGTERSGAGRAAARLEDEQAERPKGTATVPKPASAIAPN